MNTLLGDPEPPTFGALLRRWRGARRLSQLRLACEAGISSRHLSFLETGRARPSREMVQLLSDMLDVPLAERSALLVGAGYAPVYGERPLSAPDLAHYERVLEEADRYFVPPARLLGCAMAHEIGHLVQSSPAHDADGLMRAVWTAADFRRASAGRLRFSARAP